jgi:hypothetical protein
MAGWQLARTTAAHVPYEPFVESRPNNKSKTALCNKIDTEYRVLIRMTPMLGSHRRIISQARNSAL